MSDGSAGGTDQLDVGSVLRRGGTLYVVERGPSNAGDIVVGELGDRRLKPEQVPDLGDDCPNPVCDGVVENWDNLGKRNCSEGCLEWLTCFKDEGQDCDKYAGHDCDGTIVHEDAPSGHYRYTCTDCDRRGGGVKRWREAWGYNARERTLEKIRSNGEGVRNSRSVDTATDQSGGEPDAE